MAQECERVYTATTGLCGQGGHRVTGLGVRVTLFVVVRLVLLLEIVDLYGSEDCLAIDPVRVDGSARSRSGCTIG